MGPVAIMNLLLDFAFQPKTIENNVNYKIIIKI